MTYKEASHQEVLAVLKAREVRETFEAVLRIVREYCPTTDQTAVQVEADVTVSNEYDDESYFDAYTLERFDVLTVDRQRLPIIDPSSGEEIELDDLIEDQLGGLERDLLDHFEVTNGLCVLNLLEVPVAPVTLWLEVTDADAGSTGGA